MNADFVACEEWAFMPSEVWRVVVVPLLGREECVIVGITTPMVEDNFFSKLVEKKDAQGNPVFLVFTLELACKRCQERDRGHLCPHMMRYLPPFKSAKKQALMTILLSDDVATAQRENFGIMSTTPNSFIEKVFIDAWFNNPIRFVAPEGFYADTLIMAVDPNRAGSKNSSEMAIVTIALKFGVYCLVGLETHPTDNHTQVIELVEDAIYAYRDTEWLKEAHILLAIEDNTGHEAGFITHFTNKIPKVHPITDKKRDRAGIVTTRYNKPEYAMAARHRIQTGQMTIAKDLVVGNQKLKYESGSPVPDDDKASFMLGKLERQMRRYVQVNSDNASVFAEDKVTVSGVVDRAGKKDPTVNDDLMFALTFACRTADRAIQGVIDNISRDWLPKNPQGTLLVSSKRAAIEASRKRKL